MKVTADGSFERGERLTGRIGAKTNVGPDDLEVPATARSPNSQQVAGLCVFFFASVSSYASVCAWVSCVFVIERINNGDGTARSCEAASFSTMVIEPSNVERTVVTDDRIRRECRVLWLLSPRILHTVRSRIISFFSHFRRDYMCVQIARRRSRDMIDLSETFAKD